MNPAHTFRIATTREAISAFADEFADWAVHRGIPEGSIRAFQVVFDEMLTNAIDYSLAGLPAPLLEVRLQASAQALEATIIDNGPPFDPLKDAVPPDLELSVEDRPIGGLGIHLVKSLMDSAAYQRLDGRNLLRLHKRHADALQAPTGRTP